MFFTILLMSCEASVKYKIAYNVLEDADQDNYEIYIMDVDGQHAVNITNNKGVDWVYYAYDDKIYFLSDRGNCKRCFYLYEMDASGENVRQISDFELADSWLGSRKNGKEFIVKPREEEQFFYIVDIEGKIIDKIGIDLPYINDPAFSPDGAAIVFRGATKKSPFEAGFSDELFVMNLKDKNYKQLTFYPEKDSTYNWSGYQASAPRCRKDGKITFASKRGGNYDIYEINPDGTGMKAVSPVESNQVFHDWLEDGTLIFEASMDNHSNYDLYKQSPDGSLRQLTNDSIEQYAPVFVKIK